MPMDWMGPRVYPNYWYDVFNNNGERGRERWEGGGGGGEAIYAREGVFQWEGWEVGLIFILLGVQCKDNARVCSIMCTS